MAFILWAERFDTGIDEIDVQHRKLVGLINTLFDIISVKDRKIILNEALTELVNYTIYHFKTEEDLMKRNRYSDYEPHKLEHKLFVEQINKLVSKVKIDDNKALLDLINYLKDWLLNHILVTDKKYVSSLLYIN